MSEPIKAIEMDEMNKNKGRRSQFVDKLISPHASVTDPSKRREIRFLSSILLMFAMLTTVRPVIGLISGSAFEEPVPFFIVIVVAGVLYLAYGISRTKYYRVASFLAITAVTGLIYATFLSAAPEYSESTLFWLIPISVFSGILLPWRNMFVYVMFNFVFILVLPQLAPGLTYSVVTLPVSLFVVVGLLLVGLNHYRDNLERIRQETLTKSNQELKELSESLEVRVNERMQDLALATEVGRVISQIHDLDELLNQSVTLIRERFDLYYVQIYLTNNTNDKLVLRSGTGEVGKALLAKKHALNIDLTSINGRVAYNKEALIVADTRTSDVFLPNEELPETRSEMAVPLLIQNHIVGVIDLQSSEPAKLSEENLPAFSALASQLAVAIQNADLLSKMESTTRFLDSVIDNLPIMLFVKDAKDLSFIRWNKAGVELTGFAKEDLVGKNDFDFVPEEEARFFQQKDREVLNGGELVDIPEEPIQTVHQGTRLLHTIKIPILDAQGNPEYLLGISEDITERKDIARQLEGRVAQLGLLNEIGRQADETSTIKEMLEWVTEQIPTAMSYPESCVSSITLDGVLYGDEKASSYPRHIVEELRLGEGSTGHICIAYKNMLYEFHNEESALIGNVGRRISNYIENQRLINQIQEQSEALQAVAEIGTAVTSISTESELLQLVVELTHVRFGLYSADIYLVDQSQMTVGLRASAGEAGEQAINRKEFFRIDNAQAAVSRVSRSRESLIMNNVAQSSNYIANPLLPLTKAEMIIPLIAGENEVIGVLSLQAKTTDYFTPQLGDIFNTLATQVAVALQNVRQYEQTQSALDELSALQRVITGEGWQTFLGAQGSGIKGYIASNHTVKPLSEGNGHTINGDIVVPLSIRGTSIGKLGIKNTNYLSAEDKSLIEAVSRQVAEALERARLFEESEIARQQTNALYTGSEQVIRANSIDGVLDALAGSTAVSRMERANFLFFNRAWVDEQPEEMTIVAAWERNGDVPLVPVGTVYPLESYPIVNQLRRDEPLVVGNNADLQDENSRTLLQGLGINSVLAFPLVAGDQWIGILTAHSETELKLSQEEVKQISSLVSQAAVVAQTQKLFQETAARAEQEQLLRRVSERVYSAVDADSVLKTAVQEVSRSLGLEAFIYLDDEN